MAGASAPLVPAAAARWLLGCDGSGPGEFDQNAMLRELAANVMVPTFAAFDVGAGALADVLSEFADGPTTAKLAAARAAWVEARAPWKRAQAFAFGPAETLAPTIDWWPADRPAIEALLAQGGPFAVAGFGADKRGMMALEYLLFDPATDDAGIVARLASAGADLAEAVGADLAQRAADVRTEWDPEGGDYAGAFGEAGAGSAIYGSPKDAVDALVNQIVFLSDYAAGVLIAKPLGLKSGGVVQPDLEEARRADNSLVDIVDRIRGIEAVWEGRIEGGKGGLGLSDLVGSRTEALVADVRAALDAAFAALAAVPPPMREALTGAPELLQKAFDAVIALKRILGGDVVTVLGVTLTFNDNDGD